MNVHIKHRPPGQAPQAEDIAHFMQILSCVPNVQTACWMGAEFLAKLSPEDVQETTVALSHVHPFFLPDLDGAQAEQYQLNLGQFAEMALQARLTANRTKNVNVLVAGTPKSAATFIGSAVRKGLGLRSANLVSMAYSDYSASLFGANLSSKELDELALQRHGLEQRGYVAQHQVLCTPYVARQMALYGIRPIITTRNFFDSLISMDDALMETRAVQTAAGESFFDDGMPACYQDLHFEDRLHLLVDAKAIWYAQFLTSWQKCAAIGQIKPLWISYEMDILGDPSRLAEKIAEFISDNQAKAISDALTAEHRESETWTAKGLERRGQLVSSSIRQRALAIFERYAGDADLKCLIGE
ncbi:hypothetical protein [Rhizobium sp.]|jgi:hypothetical protein|uniref:hypothetical protein n=1 Tax=Rhizobium sp. TaxID=391 RepID=UPI000E7D807A|nr:hypothetical protein [Rhizobium sp.]